MSDAQIDHATESSPTAAPGSWVSAEGGRPGSRRGRARCRGWLAAASVGALVGATVSAATLVALRDDVETTAPTTEAAPAAAVTVPAAPAPAADSPTTVQAVLADVGPATVVITTRGVASGPLGRPTGGAGTGMILEADGIVVTNAHVVAGAGDIQVRFDDGTIAAATLVGTDVSHDVAVLRLDGVDGLTTVELAPSEELEVGEPVVAIGNALDLDGGVTVTQGILSALDRTIRTADGELTGLVQTDASINPGNSGGPLVDADGRVVAMNTAVAGSAENIGFAVPADAMRRSVDDILSGGGDGAGAEGGYLGVQVADDGSGRAIVAAVAPGTPAEAAGLRTGDVVLAVDGRSVGGADALVAAVSGRPPGDDVVLVVGRDGRQVTIDVTLGSRSTTT